MEGTRHEKTAILIAAYVIGFTTAFIAFGVNKMHDDTAQTVVAQNTFTKEPTSYKDVHKNISSVGFDDSGFYVTVGGYNRILSAKRKTLAANVVQSAAISGFYTNIHGAEISPDGWFVFFCEETDSATSQCDPYVYSLFDDTVYPLIAGVETISLESRTFSIGWSSNNTLTINGVASIDNKTPWKFEEISTDEAAVEVQEISEESVE